MRARFWTWENNGWVKITLAPGKSLTFRSYSRDEEGYSSESTRWTHEGTHVRMEWGMRGRDCDGGISRGGTLDCQLSMLAAKPAYDDGTEGFRPVGIPEWEEVDRHQRDEQAELAGY